MLVSCSSLSRGEIARRALSGAIYTGVAQYVVFGIGVLKAAVLARLIAPEIFGVVALATTWVSYLTFFKMELRWVVINDPASNQTRLVTQFVLEILTTASGFILAALVYVLVPTVCSVMCWQAIFIILGIRLVAAVTSTPLYMLSRDIRQKDLTYLTLAGAIVALAASVVIAYLGFPLISLLVDAAIPVVVSGVGAWLIAGWRVTRDWDFAVARDVVSFGFTLWTNGLLGKIIFDFDDWLVGTLKGETALGFYSKAYSLAKMPMDIFAGMIGQLAPALYAQSLEAGQAVLTRAYALTSWLLFRLIVLSSVVMLAATEEIVRILLGPTWLPVVPLLRLMFLFALGRPLFQNDAQLMVSMRRERVLRRFYALQAAILLVLGPPAVLAWGGAGAAVVVSVLMVVGLVGTQWYISRHVEVNVLRIYLLPVIWFILFTPLLYSLNYVFTAGAVIILLIKGTLGVVLFAGVVYLLERKQVSEVIDLVVDNLLRSQQAPEEQSPGE
jgi:O-antigen/teichoic acid export membrane protein